MSVLSLFPVSLYLFIYFLIFALWSLSLFPPFPYSSSLVISFTLVLSLSFSTSPLHTFPSPSFYSLSPIPSHPLPCSLVFPRVDHLDSLYLFLFPALLPSLTLSSALTVFLCLFSLSVSATLLCFSSEFYIFLFSFHLFYSSLTSSYHLSIPYFLSLSLFDPFTYPPAFISLSLTLHLFLSYPRPQRPRQDVDEEEEVGGEGGWEGPGQSREEKSRAEQNKSQQVYATRKVVKLGEFTREYLMQP